MLPWETLRRLLGFPSDMALPSAVELSRMAIEQPRRARLIGMALMVHPPTETPTGMLVGAIERGALDQEIGAELLGFARHRSGYRLVQAMLFASETGEETRTAGVAMARILGDDARDDLSLALRAAPTREGRDGAALGLSELGAEDDAASIVAAGREQLIRVRVVARCAAQLPMDIELWLDLLESDVVHELRMGTELIFELVSAEDEDADARLAALGDRAKHAVRLALEDRQLYMLPDKRDALAAWIDI